MFNHELQQCMCVSVSQAMWVELDKLEAESRAVKAAKAAKAAGGAAPVEISASATTAAPAPQAAS